MASGGDFPLNDANAAPLAMPSLYDVKPAFQGLLRPGVRALARLGVTANQVTLAAVGLSALGGGAVLLARGEPRWLLAVPAVLFARMALNAVDGMLAREHGMKSALGALLNELGDVVSDAALYLPLALLPGVDARWVVGFVLLALLSEMAGVVAVQLGTSRRYDGPLGKSDRAFVVGALALGLGAGWLPVAWVDPVVIAACALTALTVLNRCRRALREAAA